MQIWVDADACPKAVKEILYKVSQRLAVSVTLVANQPLSTPPYPLVKAVQVPAGFDVADNYIVQNLEASDLVITGDIPLAAEVIERGARAINPRGETYTPENIRQRLSVRDMMEELRSAGRISGGPPPLGKTDIAQFANALDRFLTRAQKEKTNS
jgi:uncharacterized protein YaiI (UPF0178 family)